MRVEDPGMGRGASNQSRTAQPEEHQRTEDLNKKGEVICSFMEADVEREKHEELELLKDEGRPVAGIPDDIMDKVAVAGGDDEKATRAARCGHKQAAYIVRAACSARSELHELVLKGVVPALLRFALEEKDSEAKKWAGTILVSIYASIGKYDKTLCKANAAYLSEKEKIIKEKQLVGVLFPGPIMEAVQRELMKSEDNRRTLFRLNQVCGRTWIQSANCQGLHDYLPFVKLQDFSLESEPKWWKFLWPVIKKNNPELLTELREGKIPTRGIRYQARWATFRKEFRNALRTLARLRSGGVR
jgi:hypothetical protein